MVNFVELEDELAKIGEAVRAQAERERAIVLAGSADVASAAPGSGVGSAAARAGASGRRASSLSLAQLAAAQGGSRLLRHARRGEGGARGASAAAADSAAAATRAESAAAADSAAAATSTEKKLDRALTAVGGWLNRLAGHDTSSSTAVRSYFIYRYILCANPANDLTCPPHIFSWKCGMIS